MEENKPDLTRNLPDEILQLIVSLLPMKEALRTSKLSTAWSNLWRPLVVHLAAGSDQMISHEASDMIKQTLAAFMKNHAAPGQLKIIIGQQIQEEDQDDQMVIVATKKIDKELHLDLSKVMKLITGTSGIFKLEPKTFCGEISLIIPLKTLHLRCVTGLAENFVSDLLSSCCYLESLKLEKCGGLERIDIITSNSALQMLEFFDCPNVDSITISAPSLKSLYYKGVLPTIIQLEGTPLLVDVKFDVGDGLGQKDFECEQLLLFLASLEDIEFLTISGWLIEWLCCAGVSFGHLDFKFSKLKKLRWIHSTMDTRKRDSLACFLNITPLLEMLSINIIGNNGTAMPPPVFHQYWHEPHLWMDHATVKSNASQLKYLKVVKIVGFSKHDDELLLMDLLLHMALNLKAMLVSTSQDINDCWKVTKMPLSQTVNWQKTNPKCMVISSSNNKFIFVLTEVGYDNVSVFS